MIKETEDKVNIFESARVKKRQVGCTILGCDQGRYVETATDIGSCQFCQDHDFGRALHYTAFFKKTKN